MLNTQKKAIPTSELFGYTPRISGRKKKHHEKSDSDDESDSDSDGDYSGIIFSKTSKAKKLFSDDEIEGPVQCKKCFSVIEKPKRKDMIKAYEECLKKKLCKRCFKRPPSSAYEEISRSMQSQLKYTREQSTKPVTTERRSRLAEVSAVSLSTSASPAVKKMIFTIGVATIRGIPTRCIFVNSAYVNKPIRLHSSVTYLITIDTENEPFLFTMNPVGGPTAIKLDSTPDPMTRGSYSLTFTASFPRRFFYQSTRSENLGGSITVADD